jgi:tetratricopeptide (TPR) repeat protein
VFGSRNPQLVEGSQAMLAGRYDVGIRLTLEGLQDTDDPRDAAAGHSNLCAGYASLKRWQEALQHCDRSLELDADNWRTYNNRAAVNLGLGHLDQALRDIEAGLALAPQSSTLKLSREIVEQHRRVKRSRDRRAIKA